MSDVLMNEKQQSALRKAVLAVCKEHKTGVLVDLDTRLSYRDKDPKDPKAASWQAYSRFLLDDGHTVYVNLRTMEASYSSKPDKFAQSKVEKRLAKKAAKREAAKAAKEAKAILSLRLPEPKAKKTPKAKAVKRVPFDKTLSTLGPDDKTTAAASQEAEEDGAFGHDGSKPTAPKRNGK